MQGQRSKTQDVLTRLQTVRGWAAAALYVVRLGTHWAHPAPPPPPRQGPEGQISPPPRIVTNSIKL